MHREEKKEYEARLRKIVLWSADVLPDEVASYIRRVAEHGYHEVTKQILNEHRPLIDNLTKEYVDFFLESMLVKTVRTSTGIPVLNYPDPHGLGIKNDLDFHPASAAQGPFFLLLDENEVEGLRLINSLANTAVEKWRLREQTPGFGGPALTPVPVVVNLPSGTRKFWGTAQVYAWFRPTYNAPHVVSSALMALEMWMERQIEKGRDAEELFHKVLSGSDCIAVPGICIAMALAYKQECLKAVLPLISRPAFWSMDIARYTFDISTSASATFDPFGQYPFHASLMEQRNKQPQRSREIRHLAYDYLFSGSNELRDSFIQAVAQFTEDLPFTYEEEKNSPERYIAIKEQMEIFQVVGDPKNFRFEKYEDGQILAYAEPPQALRDRLAEEQEKLNTTNRWIALCNWVSRSLKDRTLAAGMSLDQAVISAQELQQPGDFTEPIRLSGLEHMRLEGIVGAASVAVLLGKDWLQQQATGGNEHLAWCRKILLSASQVTIETLFDSRTAELPFHPKATAASGLAALSTYGGTDEEVDRQILRLVGDPHIQVVRSVFRGLANAWEIKPVLCWNALSLALSTSMLPRPDLLDDSDWEEDSYEFRTARESQRIQKLVSDHIDNLDRGTIPDLPRIQSAGPIDFLWDLAGSVIQQLPGEKLCTDVLSRTKLLQLHDDLLFWTIATNSPDEDGREPHGYYEWNTAFFDWATRLSAFLSIDEMRKHLLNPIRACWQDSPKLTTDLLKDYVFNRLAFAEPLTEDALTGWREICAWVLDDYRESTTNYGRAHLDSSGALAAIVFIGYGGCLLKSTWPHARLFIGIIDEWVNLVGSEPRRYADLLLMLGVFWKQFETSTVIEWVRRSCSKIEHSKEFWGERKNAERTAEMLQRLWHQRKEEVISNSLVLRAYSTIVDELVITGVPLASALQQTLEQAQSSQSRVHCQSDSPKC